MNDKIFKSAFILSVAPLITQLFSFFVLPIISRIYTPEDFGVYASIASVAGVISVIQGFGYHQAIILPKSERIAQLIFNICVTVTLCISFLLFLFFYFIPDGFNFIAKTVLDYKYFIVSLILLEGFFLCIQAFNIRKGNFKMISFSRVLRVFFNKFIILFLGLFVVVHPSNLVYADIVATSIVCILLLFAIKKHVFLLQKFDLVLIKSILYKYRQFPIYNMPADIVFRLKQAVVIYLILVYYSTQVVGYYSMSLLILTIPTTLIGGAVSEVFYKEAASYNSIEKLRKSTIELFITLMSSSLVIFVLLSLYGRNFILFFLGNDWDGATTVISALILASFNNFIVGPFFNILKILYKQNLNLLYQVAAIILSSIAILIGVKFESYFISFLLYSLFNLIIGIWLLTKIFKFLKIKFNSIILDTSKIFLNIIPIIIIFFIYDYFFINPSIYFDFLIIILSLILNYYLNFKLLYPFKDMLSYLIINPLFNLWKKKLL
tara:strand:- start:204 stop:1679 length:1476 start_codon:yes stop_codon:yes gene_type:complete